MTVTKVVSILLKITNNAAYCASRCGYNSRIIVTHRRYTLQRYVGRYNFNKIYNKYIDIPTSFPIPARVTI